MLVWNVQPVGVPAIVPADDSVRPGRNVPAVTPYTYGAVPLLAVILLALFLVVLVGMNATFGGRLSADKLTAKTPMVAVVLLSVLLLARWAGLVDAGDGEVSLDVAPLFESVAALEEGQEIRRLY